VRQKPHFIAQPTCVETQNVWLGVSGNEDRLDAPVVVEDEQQLHRAVRGGVFRDDRRRRDAEVLGEIRAQRTRQICHLLEVRHPLAYSQEKIWRA
jgi:hypothetical protein